jgi:hypothetical protein
MKERTHERTRTGRLPVLGFLNRHSGRGGAQSEERPIITLNPVADTDSSVSTGPGHGAYNVNPPSARGATLKQGPGSGPRFSGVQREVSRLHRKHRPGFWVASAFASASKRAILALAALIRAASSPPTVSSLPGGMWMGDQSVLGAASCSPR